MTASLVDVPTGLGKTDAAVLAWLWRHVRGHRDAPRRLIYVLPMRSLVEQTVKRSRALLQNLRDAGVAAPARVEVVMGGDVGENWFQQPEHPAIVVGTQDMLLSRALNRGYAMSRFAWSMAFGAINNDVLWVIDEVPLHGIGATTAAQLQGLRNKLGIIGRSETMFMSATLDTRWIDTVDHPIRDLSFLRLNDDDLAHDRVLRIVDATKTIRRAPAQDERAIAETVTHLHETGTLSLVVLNTVERARRVFDEIRRHISGVDLVLLHSRFRPPDRAAHVERMLAPIDPAGPGRIIVAGRRGRGRS